MAFGLVYPISIAIVILLGIVTVSYEQTIHAYPDGGGAYIVARDNLGEFPALMAGAALLTDYILTVRFQSPPALHRLHLHFRLYIIVSDRCRIYPVRDDQSICVG